MGRSWNCVSPSTCQTSTAAVRTAPSFDASRIYNAILAPPPHPRPINGVQCRQNGCRGALQHPFKQDIRRTIKKTCECESCGGTERGGARTGAAAPRRDNNPARDIKTQQCRDSRNVTVQALYLLKRRQLLIPARERKKKRSCGTSSERVSTAARRLNPSGSY